MKRREAFFKKILAIGISVGLTIGSIGLLSGCGQKEPENTSTPPPIVEVDPSLGGESNGGENSGTENQETKIDVSSVVNEYFGDINFANEFNLALIDLVSKKVDIEDVKDIEIVSFDKDANGKIVLNVIYEEGAEKESDQLTYEGDTTKFVNFYNLSTNSTGIINGIVTENGLTIDGKVVEDSSAHTALEEDFADLIATYNAEKTVFGAISAEEIFVKEDEKPVEYISVQSIVDDVFSDFNFDEDIKETVDNIVATRASTVTVFTASKVFAVDYEIAEDGKVAIYTEITNVSNGRPYLYSFTIEGDTTKYSDYLSLTSNFDATISKILEEKGLTLSSEIDKNSLVATEVKTILSDLKEGYTTQKAELDATPKANIISDGLFVPAVLTSEQYQAMGTTDLNDIADAILNNKKGKNYDLVIGWTMDDVVATYVEAFGSEMIDNSSTMNMVVVTKKGMFKYEMWTRRYTGDITTDRYGMILSDNPNTGVSSVTNLCEYSDNAVVYDENGERFVKEPVVQGLLYMGDGIVSIHNEKDKNRYI